MIAKRDQDRDRLRHRFLVFHGVDAAACTGAAAAAAPEAVDVSMTPPPVLVDEIAIAEWQRVAPTLTRSGQLTGLQQTLLLGYCSTLAKATRAEEIVAREGAYHKITRHSGEVVLKRHPALIDAEKSWNALRQFARQLGITAGRSGASADAEPRRAVFK